MTNDEFSSITNDEFDEFRVENYDYNKVNVTDLLVLNDADMGLNIVDLSWGLLYGYFSHKAECTQCSHLYNAHRHYTTTYMGMNYVFCPKCPDFKCETKP